MSPAIQLLQSSIGKANQMLNHGGNRLSATDRLVLDQSRRSFVKAVAIIKKHEKDTTEEEDTIESLTAEAQALFARIDYLQALSLPEETHDPLAAQSKAEANFIAQDKAEPCIRQEERVAKAVSESQEGVFGGVSAMQALRSDGPAGELPPSERPE